MRDLPDPILREDGHFDALTRFGMDAVAVEEFQLFGERRKPGFVQAIVFERDVELAGSAENLDREGVEEFVGEDDQRSFGCESAMNAGSRRAVARLGRARAPVPTRAGLCSSGTVGLPSANVFAQIVLQFRSQRGRRFLQRVREGGEEVGEFLVATNRAHRGRTGHGRDRVRGFRFAAGGRALAISRQTAAPAGVRRRRERRLRYRSLRLCRIVRRCAE